MKLLSRLRVGGGLVIIFCLFFLVVLPVRAETNPNVILFDIAGNEHIPTEQILGAISNTKIGEPLDVNKVNLDVDAIKKLGFFADVIPRTEKALNGVKLIFEVVENPIYQGVEISGLTKINPDELKPFFTQKPGTVFNSSQFSEDLRKALDFCQVTKGFYVRPKTEKIGISPDGKIRIELVEFKYGKIIIQGMTRTKDFVVRRELSFKEGDIIDFNVLREDINKIMRLRIFEAPDVQFPPSATPFAFDLVLTLKEAVGIGEFSLGVSESAGEVSGDFGYKNPNLMGLGQDLSLDVQVSKQKNNVQFSFLEPWLDSNHTSFGLSMWNSESDMFSIMNSWFPYPKYQDKDGQPILYNMHFAKMGLGLQLGRSFGANTTGLIKFNFEENDIKTFSPLNMDPAAPTPAANDALRPLHFWDNSTELQFYQNRLNYSDPYWITGGYYLSANYSVSGQFLGGAYDYQKYGLEGKWFLQLAPNLVLGTRLRGNYLTGDYPDYDSFYLGGMNQLRGYDNNRYTDDETRSLIGGQTLLSNTELRFRLPENKNLEFIAFYDIGQVGADNVVSTMKYDYGMGFRFNVPFLAVLGFDYTINSENKAGWVFKIGETF